MTATNVLYGAIFKRKSFHRFENVGDEKLTDAELAAIGEAFASFDALYPDIKTGIRIVPAERIDPGRGAEYCVLLYSERKDNYLMNAGYLGEQLDLWLVAHHIGSLWCGLGKPDLRTYHDLDFVILFEIRKISDDSKYRADMFKAARKDLREIWSGDGLGVADVTRFAPSACNLQPWYVENKDGTLTVNRYRQEGKRGIIPPHLIAYFNRIDIGIYLAVLEICLAEKGIAFDRTLFVDDGGESELTRVATFQIL